MALLPVVRRGGTRVQGPPIPIAIAIAIAPTGPGCPLGPPEPPYRPRRPARLVLARDDIGSAPAVTEKEKIHQQERVVGLASV